MEAHRKPKKLIKYLDLHTKEKHTKLEMYGFWNITESPCHFNSVLVFRASFSRLDNVFICLVMGLFLTLSYSFSLAGVSFVSLKFSLLLFFCIWNTQL